MKTTQLRGDREPSNRLRRRESKARLVELSWLAGRLLWTDKGGPQDARTTLLTAVNAPPVDSLYRTGSSRLANVPRATHHSVRHGGLPE
jgi:hypothetical protein